MTTKAPITATGLLFIFFPWEEEERMGGSCSCSFFFFFFFIITEMV